MRGRKCDENLRATLREWVLMNPSRWYAATYQQVANETGFAVSTIWRYLPLTIAKVADVLPSEIRERRDATQAAARGRVLSDVEVNEIRRLRDEGNSSEDIAFLTDTELAAVEKYLS